MLFRRKSNSSNTINQNNHQFSSVAVDNEEEIYTSIFNPSIVGMTDVKGDDRVDVSVQNRPTLNIYETISPFQLNSFKESKQQQHIAEEYEVPTIMVKTFLQSNSKMEDSPNLETNKEKQFTPSKQRPQEQELQQQESSVHKVGQHNNSESENKEIHGESSIDACSSNEGESSKMIDSTRNVKEHIYDTIDSPQLTTLVTEKSAGTEYDKLSFSKLRSADVKPLESQIININGAATKEQIAQEEYIPVETSDPTQIQS